MIYILYIDELRSHTYTYGWTHIHRYDFCSYVSTQQRVLLLRIIVFAIVAISSWQIEALGQDVPPEMVGLKAVLMPQKAVTWLSAFFSP